MKNLSFFLLAFVSFVVSSPVLARDFSVGFEAYERQDYKAAFRHWLVLEYKGDKKSGYGLGLLYRYGYGVRKDLEEAIRQFNKEGSVDSILELGGIYEEKKDDNKAVGYYADAYDQGKKEAGKKIYRILRRIKPRPDKYLHWQEIAVSLGDPWAKCDHGFEEKGKNPAKDANLRRDLKNCPEENLGEALYKIGEGYETIGTIERVKNLETALTYYEQSLARKYKPAKAKVEELGKLVDKLTHAQQFKQLVKDIGNNNAEANVQRDLMGKSKGINEITRYAKRATGFYQTIIKNVKGFVGRPYISPEERKILLQEQSFAETGVGQTVLERDSLISDLELTFENAVTWFNDSRYSEARVAFERLADKKENKAAATYYLGLMELEGLGVKKNTPLGEVQLEEARRLGDQKAMLRLAVHYYLTRGSKEFRDKGEKILSALHNDAGIGLDLKGETWFWMAKIEKRRVDITPGLSNYGAVEKYYKKGADLKNWQSYDALGQLYNVGKAQSPARYERAEQNFLLAEQYRTSCSIFSWMPPSWCGEKTKQRLSPIPYAKATLCLYYTEGRKGVKKDSVKAKKYCEN